MPKFKLNRDYVLVSLQGASVEFKKNEPAFAPEFLRREIEALGGEETDSEDNGSGGTQLPASEVVGQARTDALNKAFNEFALKNGNEGKTPTVKDVQESTGFSISGAERDAAWAEFKKG